MPAVLFQLEGPGLHGDEHTFEKPWFTTWESALSCWVSLIIFWIIKLAAKLKSRGRNATADQEQPLLSPSQESSEVGSELILCVQSFLKILPIGLNHVSLIHAQSKLEKGLNLCTDSNEGVHLLHSASKYVQACRQTGPLFARARKLEGSMRWRCLGSHGPAFGA